MSTQGSGCRLGARSFLRRDTLDLVEFAEEPVRSDPLRAVASGGNDRFAPIVAEHAGGVDPGHCAIDGTPVLVGDGDRSEVLLGCLVQVTAGLG